MMIEKINIDNQELIVLFEFKDMEYNKVIVCLDKEFRKVFVGNNKIITDKAEKEKIKNRYNLELPDEFKGIVF